MKDKAQIARARGKGAVALINSKRYEEALREITQALAIDPDNPSYLSRHALVLRRLGRLSETESAALQLLKIAPATSRAYSILADIYRLQGRFEDAAAASSGRFDWRRTIPKTTARCPRFIPASAMSSAARWRRARIGARCWRATPRARRRRRESNLPKSEKTMKIGKKKSAPMSPAGAKAGKPNPLRRRPRRAASRRESSAKSWRPFSACCAGKRL